MTNPIRKWSKLAAAVAVFITGIFLASSAAFGGKSLEGQWIVDITIPESPNTKEQRTFTVHLDVDPRGNSLHGRMLITDEENREVGGVWRQVGKKVFITYELPCSPDGPCASLVMIGKIKKQNTKLKKGKVIVMWDTPNDQNPALYDTSNGKFAGDRLQ